MEALVSAALLGNAQHLADAFAARGQGVEVVSVPLGVPWIQIQRRLDDRLYEEGLVRALFNYRALTAGDYDIAHAMTAADGLAALRWSRKTGRPAVLTYDEVPTRQSLCARRRRLEITRKVTAGCTVVAVSNEVADGLRRWLGVQARVIEPHDNAALRYLQLYRELL